MYYYASAITITTYVSTNPPLSASNVHSCPLVSCDEYKHSFWPRTISKWNISPPEIITMESKECFKSAVNAHLLV